MLGDAGKLEEGVSVTFPDPDEFLIPSRLDKVEPPIVLVKPLESNTRLPFCSPSALSESVSFYPLPPNPPGVTAGAIRVSTLLGQEPPARRAASAV